MTVATVERKVPVTRTIRTKRELRDAVAYYLDQPAFAFDTETKGEFRLDPRRNQVFWMSLAGPGRADVIPFGHPIGRQNGTTKEPRYDKNGKARMFTVPTYSKPPDQLWPADVFEAFEPVFFDPERIKVGHNLKFDVESTAKYYDNEIMPGPYACTMVAAKLINENLFTYRLGDCIARAFGFTYDKSVGKAVETYPYAVAARYAYLDAKYTWLLYRKYRAQLEREYLDGLFALEMELLGVLAKMEQNGSPLVDIDALRDLDADLDEQIAEITGELYRLAGRVWNFNSNPQKIEVFYGRKRDGGQGLRAKEWTPTGLPSTKASALEPHAGNLLVDKFAEFQELDKISGTYVKAYLGNKKSKGRSNERNNAPPYNPDTGRIHTNFKQTGTVTGRLSSSEPNVQNIPRPDTDLGKRIRGLFVAEPGHKLIVADWSQVEYRILAYYSRDKRLVQAFEDGLDFHLYVASLLLSKSMDDVTGVERTLSKNCNFAVAYGAGAERIAIMSGVTVKEAEKFLVVHQRMLPGMYKFCEDVVKRCKSRRPQPYVMTLLGRKRRLRDINSRHFGTAKAAERQAVNSVIQGSAADLMKLAIVREDDLLIPGMILNFTVHDELVTSVREDLVDEGVAIVREAMEGKEIAALIAPVPLIADIKVVDRWSEAKE